MRDKDGVVNVDLTPEQGSYKPPVNSEKHETTWLLGGGHKLYWRTHYHPSRWSIVDFAFTQIHPDREGEEAHVARIDCCHWEIHKHQYYRSGKHGSYTPICPFTQDNAWDTMDSKFTDCHSEMMNGWQDHLERWDSG